MLESKAFSEIEGILSPDDFYDDANAKIFASIAGLSNKQEPIDMATVAQELRKKGELESVGGPLYISQLTEKVGSAAHIEFHARIIAQKSLARKIISAASDISRMAFDETVDVDDVIEEYEKSFSRLTFKSSSFQSVEMDVAIKMFSEYVQNIQKMRNQGGLVAVPTHLRKLDKALDGGFRGGELNIIGARPSMGKTQHSLAMAISESNSGINVFYVSIEMKLTQLMLRLVLEDDMINKTNLRTGQMTNSEWIEFDRKIGQLYGSTLNISDHHSIRYLQNIKSEARRLHRQNKLDIMFIDYLQLIRTNLKFQSRQLEVAYITGELKALAKELDIPIVALAQLNRPAKGTRPKEPDLEDLREAGDIEQDADIVMMLHLPLYYVNQYTEGDDRQSATKSFIEEWTNRGMLIIRKSREGVRNNTVCFRHDERYKKIWDDGDDPPHLYATSHLAPMQQDIPIKPDNDDLPF